MTTDKQYAERQAFLREQALREAGVWDLRDPKYVDRLFKAAYKVVKAERRRRR